jgi:hypothetical protein
MTPAGSRHCQVENRLGLFRDRSGAFVFGLPPARKLTPSRARRSIASKGNEKRQSADFQTLY